MTWQSKEDQREHIRAQLRHEIHNPSIWYPFANPRDLKYLKLKSDLYKVEQIEENGDENED
jgi:hypothetical protein